MEAHKLWGSHALLVRLRAIWKGFLITGRKQMPKGCFGLPEILRTESGGGSFRRQNPTVSSVVRVK
ncbi:hypothetical protein ACFPIB_01560 [Adhaeribacter terreus]|uniref:Uncharacterized protein n=1 Tax=Adhaeribacter terreus TaxID=529703 RepID=A0ABW0E4L2_9BACT